MQHVFQPRKDNVGFMTNNIIFFCYWPQTITSPVVTQQRIHRIKSAGKHTIAASATPFISSWTCGYRTYDAAFSDLWSTCFIMMKKCVDDLGIDSIPSKDVTIFRSRQDNAVFFEQTTLDTIIDVSKLLAIRIVPRSNNSITSGVLKVCSKRPDALSSNLINESSELTRIASLLRVAVTEFKGSSEIISDM
jgi:hypothetical protein